MNIGDKDEDGWIYVRFGDAAKAAQEGAHEVQASQYDGGWFCNSGFYGGRDWRYRIREKARTITVTELPIPARCDTTIHARVELLYINQKDAERAGQIIRAAMEQS